VVKGAVNLIDAGVIELLLQARHSVTGLNNLKTAYEIKLKEGWLRCLLRTASFCFHWFDIGDRASLEVTRQRLPLIGGVVNLAAHIQSSKRGVPAGILRLHRDWHH
jgi:hypothetical protein